MNPTPLYAFSVEPFRTWSAFAWKTAETMLASAQVIARRTDLLISTGNSPSASNQREFALMGQEKIAAASESAQAMAFGWMSLNQELGALAFRQMMTGITAFMSLAASRSPAQSIATQTRLVRDTLARSAAATSQVSKSTGRLAHRGINPIHARATGNAKRLAKRK